MNKKIVDYVKSIHWIPLWVQNNLLGLKDSLIENIAKSPPNNSDNRPNNIAYIRYKMLFQGHTAIQCHVYYIEVMQNVFFFLIYLTNYKVIAVCKCISAE